MKLFVANSSKQTLKLWYRIPGRSQRAIPLHIPSGEQAEIRGVSTKEEVDGVIRQIETFGGRDAREVSNSKLSAFPGIIYSIDKPVSVENYEIGNAAVEEHQDKRAAEESMKAAKGFDLSLRGAGKKRAAKKVEVEIKQEVPRGERPKDPIAMDLEIASE